MYKLGYVPGCFDLLHEGHLALLRRAKRQCETLVVGVVSDLGAKAYKYRLPAQTQETRMEVVRELRMVDFVVLQLTTDPTPNLDAIRPHVLFHGDDWEQLREGQKTLELLGIDFVKLPYTHGISTTAIIQRIVEGVSVAHADTVPIDVIPTLVRRSMDKT